MNAHVFLDREAVMFSRYVVDTFNEMLVIFCGRYVEFVLGEF